MRCPSQQRTQGTVLSLCLGTSVGYLVPGGQEDRREVSVLLSGCPLINITSLINIKAFSAAHFEELPTIHFSFWLQ